VKKPFVNLDTTVVIIHYTFYTDEQIKKITEKKITEVRNHIECGEGDEGLFHEAVCDDVFMFNSTVRDLEEASARILGLDKQRRTLQRTHFDTVDEFREDLGGEKNLAKKRPGLEQGIPQVLAEEDWDRENEEQ